MKSVVSPLAGQGESEGDCLYTIRELSRATHLSVPTLYKEIGAGRLQVVKIGRATRVRASAKRAWLDSLPLVSKR